MKVYFSDFFDVSPSVVEDYGAFNISLITDLPLFIDPFLLFNSTKPDYIELHNEIIKYLTFLKVKATDSELDSGLISLLYKFSEVEQNWLGYSQDGNKGRGLGNKFATALHGNLNKIFSDFGDEGITKGAHLEKILLIHKGVGRDSISDFTTNLIHKYLLLYTQKFARRNIDKKYLKNIRVPRVEFNYSTQSWMEGTFELPIANGSHVILSPKDILTKDETWINRADLIRDFASIPDAISNEQLRAAVNNYLVSVLPINPTQADWTRAIGETITKYPDLVDYYIKQKESDGDKATSISNSKVAYSENLYVDNFRQLPEQLDEETDFYKISGDTFEEAHQRLIFLKHVIEDRDGYRIFYVKGSAIEREEDLQILYKLCWFASTSEADAEVNNGRGPADFKISRGSKDKSLVELKLASNKSLERNLIHQVPIYEAANQTKKSLKAIIYFSELQYRKVSALLTKLKLQNDSSIILIDARSDNKPSGSVAGKASN